MSDEVLPKFISDRVDQIIKENSFRDYTVDINSGSKLCTAFMSKITTIQVAERDSEKELHLVCKVAPLNANRRKEFISEIAFGREVLFYNKLMPLFAKFQGEKGLSKDDQFLEYPKCYGTVFDSENEHYAIFLEDLRPRKFKLWNKAMPMPFDNVRLAMREIGKLHGISFVMKDQRPDDFAEFKELNDTFRSFLVFEKMSKVFGYTYTKAVDSLKNDHHKNVFRDIEKNFLQYFDDCLNEKRVGPFGVVCHGDLWNNNLLFKEDDNTAEDLRLLDWQVMRYASPAIDILYNIFTSTDQALRAKEYNNLLRLYYASLSKTVKLLGSNPEDIFTFDDLLNELKRYGIYALLMAPMLIETLQADLKDTTSLDERVDKMVEEDSQQNYNLADGLSTKAQLEFERRLTGVVEDILRLGYYHPEC